MPPCAALLQRSEEKAQQKSLRGMWANLRGYERAKAGGKIGRSVKLHKVEKQAGERGGVAYASPPRLTASGNAGRVTVFGVWQRNCSEGLSFCP